MARSYRSGRKSRSWGAYHISERSALAREFGYIDRDVESAFLALPFNELDELFDDYGQEYGKSAESYARRTFPSWKSGAVKLSGQTAERLMQLLPPRLSSGERYELIRKLRNHYIRRSTVHVSTDAADWRQNVMPAVDRLIQSGGQFSLPESLQEKAQWLAAGDSQVACTILNRIEKEEAVRRTAYLEAEFKRIEFFVAHVKHTSSASHTISLPQGEIHVTIQPEKRPLLEMFFGLGSSTMTENGDGRVPHSLLQMALSSEQDRGRLINRTLNDLSESQLVELKKKILEEQISLEVSQIKADQRFHNSSRDMANTVQTIRDIEQSTKSDYEISSNYETASGQTRVTVKRNNNTVLIIVAIVIGVIAFLLLDK